MLLSLQASAVSTEPELNQAIELFNGAMSTELKGIHLDIKYSAKAFQASMADGTLYLAMDGGSPSPQFAPMMTLETYVLILCHELGHAQGGFMVSGSQSTSIEGQADYYATYVCAPKVFPSASENALANKKLNVSQDLVTWCKRHQTSDDNFQLCLRVGTAAQTLASAFAVMSPFPVATPGVATPDCTQVVNKFSGEGSINSHHPRPQCRLDSYLRGLVKLPQPSCWYNVGSEDKTEFFKTMDSVYGEPNICQKSCKSLPADIFELDREQRCLSSMCTRVLYPMIYSEKPMDSFTTEDQQKAFEIAKIIASGDTSPIQGYIESGKQWCDGPKKNKDCVDSKIDSVFRNCAK